MVRSLGLSNSDFTTKELKSLAKCAVWVVDAGYL